MPLQYAHLIAQTPTDALVLLQKATADEIKTLIAETKSAKKPLLRLYLEEMVDGRFNQPQQLNACIKILLDHTQGNWDHEFPEKATDFSDKVSEYFQKLIMPFCVWVLPRDSLKTYANVAYRVSPEVVIHQLQFTTGGIFRSKKSLYTYLLENRSKSYEALLAVSAVLGQAETKDVAVFKKEINQVLTLGPESKDHEFLLLKHEELFEPKTKQFLNDYEKLPMTADQFDLYTIAIDFKRGTLSRSGVEKIYVKRMIAQPGVFFVLLGMDKLSVKALIMAFDQDEIKELIAAAHNAGMNPRQLLIDSRENRSPVDDQILFDAIVKHADPSISPSSSSSTSTLVRHSNWKYNQPIKLDEGQDPESVINDSRISKEPTVKVRQMVSL